MIKEIKSDTFENNIELVNFLYDRNYLRIILLICFYKYIRKILKHMIIYYLRFKKKRRILKTLLRLN